MHGTFQDYLLSKQSVDDRALNKDVLKALTASLPNEPLKIIEVGAGIGTMLKRLVKWGVIHQCEYVMVDGMPENIEYANRWIKVWAAEAGLSVERRGDQIGLSGEGLDIQLHLEADDIFRFIHKNDKHADLLIAHAFLDLLPLKETLSNLFTLTNDLAWLTINFDDVTTFEPSIDPKLDQKIERLYHDSMNARATGGDSKSGRRLFGRLQKLGLNILAAGSSDWVVYPTDGVYPQDEADFLNFILDFFEESLKHDENLAADELSEWISGRRAQIELGELVYIAHQMDFLVKK